MSEFWRDVRFGLRLLAHSRVFALTVALLLGIGIGANTLIFSLVDTLLLRPLPVTHAERLVRLIEVHPTGFVTWDLPVALYEQLAANASTMTDVLCQADLDLAFEEGAAIERIRVNAVSGNFFSALGIQARLGRVLTADDDGAGLPLVVVSYDFWHRRLGASSSIVGRNIRLSGRAFTVVGVLPKGVNGLNVDTTPDIRIPLNVGRLLAEKSGMDSDGPVLIRYQIFGQLRKGVTLERAEAEIEPVLRGIYEEALIRHSPELAKLPRKDVFDSRLRLEPAGRGVSSLRDQFSGGLILLMVCVGLLLLMACANVVCLLLARSAARAQEIGIRLMLGASSGRVARQLLTESLVLSLAGGAVGVLLAYTCAPLLLAALPPIRDRAAVLQPLAVHVDLDLRVLVFAIAASFATALLFGLAPALRGARHDLACYARGSRSSTVRLSGRNILLVAQIAICVLLMASATVLIETFNRMRSMNTGFDSDSVVTFTIDPGLKGYKPERAKILSRQLLEKTRALPGVVAAGIASRGVMRGTGVKSTFGVAGTPISRSDFLNSSLNNVTPGYFDTMGMRIVEGRDFTWSDDNQQKPRKVIVNQAFVRRFFPAENPLGRLFGGRGPDGLAARDDRIVGVVSDAKYRSLREEIPPTVYGPAVNGFDSSFILHLRTQGRPEGIIAPVRATLRSLDAELPFVEVRTLREEVETSLWQERLLARLSTIFSFFAAVLAGIGLYGAIDLAAKARTREIGVRVALGADPLHVIRLLSKETLLLVTAGAASGMAIHVASAQWMRHVLYGVETSDHVALVSAVLVIGAVGFLAIVFPVWRAVRIQPATALRHE